MVLTCNEADRIEPCLRSVHGWCDELLVIDSGSTDATVEIAQRYATRVYETDWPGFGPQRNRALSYCTGEWVMTLDADEVVTDELRREIDAMLSGDLSGISALAVPWQAMIFGREVRHGRYTAPQVRIFRRAGAAFLNVQVHEAMLPAPGRVVVLRARLPHDSFRNYQHAVDKHTHYAVMLAERKFSSGKTGGLLRASLRARWEFIVQYFFRGLILDGSRGYFLAVLLSQYAYHKYAALWAMSLDNKKT
ncbi:MAG: glycosyltransferase family 2 protein [Stenotrophobium sp.]